MKKLDIDRIVALGEAIKEHRASIEKLELEMFDVLGVERPAAVERKKPGRKKKMSEAGGPPEDGLAMPARDLAMPPSDLRQNQPMDQPPILTVGLLGSAAAKVIMQQQSQPMPTHDPDRTDPRDDIPEFLKRAAEQAAK